MTGDPTKVRIIGPQSQTVVGSQKTIATIVINRIGPQGPPGFGTFYLTLDGLRAVPTIAAASQSALKTVVQLIGGNWLKSDWFLVDGTDVDDPVSGVIRPDDFDFFTNAKVWVRVSGL